MHQENFTFSQARQCYREAYRLNLEINKTTEKSEKASDIVANTHTPLNDSQALIDAKKKELNFELCQPHKCLSSAEYDTDYSGRGIADYYRKVIGRSPRMKGDNKYQSKAVGCIITLPKDYIEYNFGLSRKEIIAIEKVVENDYKYDKNTDYQSAIKKISNYNFTDNDIKKIKEFFEAAYAAWKINANIRDEDILYAIVHMDESFPHLHIMCLPGVVKQKKDPDTGEISERFSYTTSIFAPPYYENLHKNVIQIMKDVFGIDATGLLNGKTKENKFIPSEFTRNQREESVRLSRINDVLKKENEKLNQQEQELRRQILEIQQQLELLNIIFREEIEAEVKKG